MIFEKRYLEKKRTTGETEARAEVGRACAIFGLAGNVSLAIGKLLIGFFSRSIAITADGWNNFSDAMSSAFVLLSFHLSKKPADREHPYGHARSEYIGSLLLSVFLFVIAAELLVSSYHDFFERRTSEAGPLTYIVLAYSIVLKAAMFFVYHGWSRRIGSPLLKASAVDSLGDILTSSLLVVSAVAGRFTDFPFDAVLGALLALLIGYNGFQTLRETLDNILGSRAPSDLIDNMERRILDKSYVHDLHDLYLHDYGPGRIFGSCHIEIDADMDLLEAHDLADEIEREMARDYGISFVVHVDPYLLDDPEDRKAYAYAKATLKEFSESLDLHDFHARIGKSRRNLSFDVRLPEGDKRDPKALGEAIKAHFETKDPHDNVIVTVESENLGLPIGEVIHD